LVNCRAVRGLSWRRGVDNHRALPDSLVGASSSCSGRRLGALEATHVSLHKARIDYPDLQGMRMLNYRAGRSQEPRVCVSS
jgi:hypothetical protein